MNAIQFNRGDILIGLNNLPKDRNHYIIFYDQLDGIDFVGGMLSSKPYNGKNIPMNIAHFEEVDGSTGKPWRVQYRNSHLVTAKLHKFNTMGPFIKIGRLSRPGVAFVENTIDNLPLLSWADYKSQ